MQLRLIAQVNQRQNCGYSVLQGCFAISLIEPEQAHRQLPQVISNVTDREFAGLGGARPPPAV